MALLFAEHGVTVSLEDPSEETVQSLIETGKKAGLESKLAKHQGYEELCKSLDSPKVFVLSLPHGTVGDTVVDGLKPYLEKGDIFIDASNENWQNTQRRQGKLVAQGVYYVGMGVSGGYQAARRGPSMCPGGEDKALDIVLPLLQKVAAKAEDGTSCVAKIGTGGAGHYVKMIHNGIEHGMMSAISEAWQIMAMCLGMGYDAISDEFDRWNSEGELVPFPFVPRDSCTTLTRNLERHVSNLHRRSDLSTTRGASQARPRHSSRQSRPRYRRIRRHRNLVQHRSNPFAYSIPNSLHGPLYPSRVGRPRPTDPRQRHFQRAFQNRPDHSLCRAAHGLFRRSPPRSLRSLSRKLHPGDEHHRRRQPRKQMVHRLSQHHANLARRLHHPVPGDTRPPRSDLRP